MPESASQAGAANAKVPSVDLSDAQAEIMEIVWERGEVAACNVLSVLQERRDVARNTVRTLLQRMEDKGWLRHRTEGRTYLYSATVERNATIGQKVVQVLDDVCGGCPEALVTALLDHRGLTTSELNRVAALIEQAKSQRSNSSSRSTTKTKAKSSKLKRGSR